MKKHSTKFKVLSTLLVVFSVFGFLHFVAASGNEGKIELTKTATKLSERFDEKNLEEGRFADVTLNVKANSYSNQETVYSKLDIVLVLDSSGSMGYGPTGKNDKTTPNRIDSAKTAATEFINTMMDDGDAVQIGLVDYSENVNRTQDLTSNKQTALDFLGTDYYPEGGTNLQSGIAAVSEILKKGRTDAKKLVIILTDGVPTYFNNTYTDRECDFWGRNCKDVQKVKVCGTGNSDTTVDQRNCPSNIKPSDAAKTELDSLKLNYPNADVYTITLGEEKEAATTLAKINPVGETSLHKYKNVTALNYEELAKEFKKISSVAKNTIAKNAKVVDIIPKEFELTAESKAALEKQGVTITEVNGETRLEWNIGELKGDKDNSLTYTVKAKDEYHGSIYTNKKATLSAEIDKDNPYPDYKGKTNLELTFDKPTVEIPAVINADHYSTHPSYNSYENIAIKGESILTNDLLNEIKKDIAPNKTKVEVTDEIIINTDTNVVKTGDTYTISKDGVLQGTLQMNADGTFTFTPEPGFSGEVSFTYYVKTTINEHHETETVRSNNATVTLNIISSPKVSITGEKTWDDANNQDGLRPEAITVRLFNGQEEVASQRVVEVNGKWTYEFTNLPKYVQGYENDDNHLINYTVKEDTVSGYETTINNYNIINKHTPKLININVEKIWNDDNNNDGLRPESITIRLYKGEGADKVEVTSVTLTSANTTDSGSWTYEFTDLPERENGKKIIYTITEDEVNNYTGKVTGNMADGFTITNAHTNITRDLTVEKVWQDSSNNDGKRPTSITIRLYKVIDKEFVEVPNTTVTLTSANATTNDNWTYTYKNLPKYENGTEITYIVREDALDSTLGYTTTYDDANYKIFNTYRTEIIRIEGTKTWNDDNNRDGIRPETIEVTLTGKVGTREVYKETKIVSTSDNWSYIFEDLAKYDAGSIIDYKISENNVAGYSTTINNYNITNTHTPDMLTITGKKVWDDAENQDGKRPESITVILNKTVKGETTEVARTTVTEDNEGNWTFTFTDLYAKEDGEDIIYTVDEITVDGYTKSIEDYTITNTHTPETISYNLTKNWEDYDNNDGLRPEKITIKVYANNELVKTIEMSAENNWTATTGDLPKYNNGEEIVYTFVEDEVKGYESSVREPVKDNDGNTTIVIVNYHEIETIDLTIEKVWDDSSNNDGKRPESITIRLYKVIDKKNIEVPNTTVTLTSANATTNDNWTYTYKNLPKYENGTEITYIVREDALDSTLGYTTTYDDANYKIFNTYRTEIIRIEGTKTWNDDNNRDGIRPETIEVTLTGKVGTREVYKETKIVSTSDNWSYIFEDLAKYDAGSIIDYKISENNVAGYSTTIDNYNITNTHTPETTSYNLTKNWEDYDNNDGLRPEKITIKVYANNELVKTIEMSAENNWTATTGDLPKYNNGEEIVYTFVEDEVKGYESSVREPVKDNDGNTTIVIVNYHEIETIDLTIEKVWDDAGHEDVRPSSIIVSIFADGEEFETIKITAENNWTYTLENLQKYKKGQEIKYTIEEEKLDNYETKYDGYTITNSYIEQEIITQPNTGVKEAISSNTYCELIALLLGALGITYTLKKREN